MAQDDVILDERGFLDRYWFDNHQTITVKNPTTEDFTFKMVLETGVDRITAKMRTEQRTFMVPAGGTERFIGSVANLYLDQMSKHVAQLEHKFADISDWHTKGKYYADLIVGIDDPLNSSTFVAFDDERLNPKPEAAVATEEAFSGLRAAEADRERLERENTELRARLDAQAVPDTTRASAQPEEDAKPFAGAASDVRRGPVKNAQS